MRALIAALAALLLLAACNTAGRQTDALTSETASANGVQAAYADPSAARMHLAGLNQANPSVASSALPASLTNQGLDYRLNPLDVVEVAVFREPDLSATATIDANGLITMPLIGAVMAAGKTTSELALEIEEKLGARYLQSPQVRVTVKEYSSQQVTVYGAVGSPGTKRLMGDTTLLQVMAQSGGLKRVADPRGVLIFRTIDGERKAAAFDIRKIADGKAPDPTVKGGDIIVVDESAIRSAWRDVREVLGAAGTFRTVASLAAF